MTISSTMNRLISTLLAIFHTRLELVTVELEEEIVRFSSYFVFALIAVFCAGITVMLGLVLIIVVFWDDHRIAVLVSLISLFGILSITLAAWLKAQVLKKPRLLEHSIAELKKDTLLFRTTAETDPKTEQP